MHVKAYTRLSAVEDNADYTSTPRACNLENALFSCVTVFCVVFKKHGVKRIYLLEQKYYF